MPNFSSLKELVKCRAREFRREPSAFFFVLLMPLVWMVALGFGLDGKGHERFGVGWLTSTPRSSNSAVIHQALADALSLKLTDGTPEELTRLLRRGEILVIVEVTNEGAHYSFDPNNRESRPAREVVNSVVQTALGRRDVTSTTDTLASASGTRYVDFLVPGLLAMTILSTSIFGTGMTIVANRRENLLKRFLATPMRPYEYILSHIIGRMMILVFEITSVLLAAKLIFKFRIEGSIVDFLFVAVLGAAALTSIGILAGSRASNSGAMNGISNLITLPLMILSGIWFSRTSLPLWLGELMRWLPLAPLVDGLRRVALEGATLSQLGFELTVLAVYFVVGSVAARFAFKWY